LTGTGNTPEALAKAGWKLVATTSGADVDRILEMCRELEVDIHLEEVPVKDCGGCTVCYVDSDMPVTRIYIRGRGGA